MVVRMAGQGLAAQGFGFRPLALGQGQGLAEQHVGIRALAWSRERRASQQQE